MNRLFYVASTVAMLLAFSACDDDDENNTDNVASNISETTIEANRFVHDVMTDYYLWYNYMPSLNYKNQPDTKAYFDTLCYSGDRFSFIIDDAESYLKAEEGISTEKGWDYTLMLYKSNSDDVIAVVNYVYPNTPAYKAGVKRGDVIMTVNGTQMTVSNYNIFNSGTATYGAKRYNATNDVYDDVTYNIASAQIETSPVAEHSIFDTKIGKIGYLLYMDYYDEFNNELSDVFSEFKSEGVTDLILDLRYNTGGAMLAMQHLCSLIAPAANVSAKDLLIYYKFNDKLTSYPDYNKESTGTYFEEAEAGNSLNLNRIAILVGSSTYSASEATIIGLQPYMDVYTFGYTTGGKNTSMFVLQPSDFTNQKTGKPYYSSDIDNWLIAPIVAQYYNANDYTFDTSNKKGIKPDYEFNEYSYDDMGTLGNQNEPLTALALQFLTDGTVEGNKAAQIAPQIIAHSDRFGGAIISKPIK